MLRKQKGRFSQTLSKLSKLSKYHNVRCFQRRDFKEKQLYLKCPANKYMWILLHRPLTVFTKSECLLEPYLNQLFAGAVTTEKRISQSLWIAPTSCHRMIQILCLFISLQPSWTPEGWGCCDHGKIQMHTDTETKPVISQRPR